MKETIERLQKLINHERSARSIGNVAEAEAFAARIQELLLKHKLDMTDIEFAEQEQNEPVAQDFLWENDITEEMECGRRQQRWVGALLLAVSEANFCDAISAHKKNAYFLIGRQSDKRVVRQLFKYLYDACIEVVAVKAEEYKSSGEFLALVHLHGKQPAAVVRTFISGFKLGFSAAISERLGADREAARKKLQGANETGLIRLDQLERAVQDFKEQHHKHLRKLRCSTRGVRGYELGKAYGSAVGLSSTPRLGA
jgi:hypothetical protein